MIKYCLGFFVLLVFLKGLAFSSDNCPINKVKIDSLNQLFKEISPIDYQTIIEYDSSKSTLLFSIYDKGQLLKSYKALVADIHPEGIFYIEQDGMLFLKIISRCSGNVFIETDHKGKYVLSKTTSRLILGGYSAEYKYNIMILSQIFQSVIFDCQDKKENEEDDISLPMMKKN
ncbi:MAG: hypothetical protein RJQ14_01855 [Marinoscillum sp.]